MPCDQISDTLLGLVDDLYPLSPQMLKHTKTVCTHQVRECDYKDMGCTYKVSHSIYSFVSLVSTQCRQAMCTLYNVTHFMVSRPERTSSQVELVQLGISWTGN